MTVESDMTWEGGPHHEVEPYETDPGCLSTLRFDVTLDQPDLHRLRQTARRDGKTVDQVVEQIVRDRLAAMRRSSAGGYGFANQDAADAFCDPIIDIFRATAILRKHGAKPYPTTIMCGDTTAGLGGSGEAAQS